MRIGRAGDGAGGIDPRISQRSRDAETELNVLATNQAGGMRQHQFVFPERQGGHLCRQAKDCLQVNAVGNHPHRLRRQTGRFQVVAPARLRHRHMAGRRNRFLPAGSGILRIHRRDVMNPVDPAQVRMGLGQGGQFTRPLQIEGHGEDIVDQNRPTGRILQPGTKLGTVRATEQRHVMPEQRQRPGLISHQPLDPADHGRQGVVEQGQAHEFTLARPMAPAKEKGRHRMRSCACGGKCSRPDSGHAPHPSNPIPVMSKNTAKKIINDPLKCADELFEGLVLAYDGKARRVGKRSIVMNDLRPDAPALLIGGGAGHEPIYHGLVGKGMGDGAAVGDIFAAPPPDIVLEATQAVNRGKGVLYLYGNYAGDVMNFDIGAELAADEGIEVKTVIINDDVCSAPPTEKGKRRGIAGLVPVVKLAGAAASQVDSLDELARIAQKAVDMTRTVGVSTKPGSIPATGAPTFELPEELIGLGMGIHGEKGVGLIPMCTADELAAKLLELLFADDLELNAGDEIVFFVNSLGSTHLMELLILLRAARPILEARGLKVHQTICDNIVTCQEMAGVSFSVTKLDAELKQLWDLPCESLGYTKL